MTAPEGTFGRRNLDPARIAATIERLSRRCDIRFPDSGLSTICRNLLDIARRTADTAVWIDRPLVPLRIAIALLLVVIAAGVVTRRTMTRFELTRYLDYCSEALSLTGKVAALYIQNFEDEVALQAVNKDLVQSSL
jgi:hypothetical protein